MGESAYKFGPWRRNTEPTFLRFAEDCSSSTSMGTQSKPGYKKQPATRMAEWQNCLAGAHFSSAKVACKGQKSESCPFSILKFGPLKYSFAVQKHLRSLYMCLCFAPSKMMVFLLASPKSQPKGSHQRKAPHATGRASLNSH